jgi:hypothetical protein
MTFVHAYERETRLEFQERRLTQDSGVFTAAKVDFSAKPAFALCSVPVDVARERSGGPAKSPFIAQVEVVHAEERSRRLHQQSGCIDRATGFGCRQVGQ